jgi:hypothetical protein
MRGKHNHALSDNTVIGARPDGLDDADTFYTHTRRQRGRTRYWPSINIKSDGWIAAAAMRTKTLPAPGTGSGLSAR